VPRRPLCQATGGASPRAPAVAAIVERGLRAPPAVVSAHRKRHPALPPLPNCRAGSPCPAGSAQRLRVARVARYPCSSAQRSPAANSHTQPLTSQDFERADGSRQALYGHLSAGIARRVNGLVCRRRNYRANGSYVPGIHSTTRERNSGHEYSFAFPAPAASTTCRGHIASGPTQKPRRETP